MLGFITLPVAIVLGFLAGLGVGGGSLLILWLTMAVGMEYASARTVNLLFFLPTALICTLFRRKQGSVKLKKILPAILWGCIAAALSAFIGQHIQTDMLKKVFGGLLLFTGLKELFYKSKH